MKERIRRRINLGISASSDGMLSESKFHGKARKDDELSSFLWFKTISVFFLLWLSYAYYKFYSIPPARTVDNSKPREFTEENTRIYLDNLVKVGARISGSWENDVYVVEYIMSEVEKIKRISKNKMIELEIQRPSGSFVTDFLDGMGSVYSNITNTVVKMKSATSSEHALLLNCHTDTVINSPGASDDAVACAVMLEIMQAIAVDQTSLLHQLIFLFNGAEENFLQASHGFITQHRWAKQIKAFINLEALGAGGEELLFQVGPDNPWLLEAWANYAPHKNVYSVAQEIFESGIIPAATDFKIYTEFGNIPGIDLAYVHKGEIYHTHFDTPEMIQPGSIQCTGDNIVAVTRHLVQSPESMLDKSKKYKNGKFCVLTFGNLLITIPARVFIGTNYLTVIAIAAYIIRRVSRPWVTGYSKNQYIQKILQATLIHILASTVVPITMLLLVAGFVTAIDLSKSWLTLNLLGFGIYLPVALIGNLIVHSMAKTTFFRNDSSIRLEMIFFDVSLLTQGFLLFLLRNFMSSMELGLSIQFALIGRVAIARQLFSFNSDISRWMRLVAHLAILSLPNMILMKSLWYMNQIAIPLSGRLGNDLPPELIMVLMTTLIMLGPFSFVSTTIYLAGPTKRLQITLAAVTSISLLLACTRIGFPYSGDPTNPTPKRIIISHLQREFLYINNKVHKNDSGIIVINTDYAEGHNIGSDDIMNEEYTRNCKGLFCEISVFVPYEEAFKRYKYIPAAPPSNKIMKDYPFHVNMEHSGIIEDIGQPTSGRVRIHVSVTGPTHMVLNIGPYISNATRSTLSSWSLDCDHRAALNKFDIGKSEQLEDSYFVFYGSGRHSPPWEFWLEFSIQSRNDTPIKNLGQFFVSQIALQAHYFPSGPVSKVCNQTEVLKKVTGDLKDWVSPWAWVSLYKHYLV